MLNYQANFAFRQYGVVFMLNWKCGSSSLLQCTANARLDERAIRRHTVPKISVRDIASGDWLAIAIVRHPLTRLQSCWKEKVRDNPNMVVLEHLPNQRPTDFETFVEHIVAVPDEQADLHFRSQHCSMMWNEKPQWDMILQLEHIGDTWPLVQARVREHSGWELGEFPHYNETKDTPEYSEHTRALAIERYAMDFHLFGYEFDG